MTTEATPHAPPLTYLYSITLSMRNEAMTFHRLASMSVHEDAQGWRVVSLHVSNAPQPEPNDS
jgi:hypothetical protein